MDSDGTIVGPEIPPGDQPAGERIGRGQGSEAEKARYVRSMFGAIAPRYDLTNTLISGGLHLRWKRATAALVQLTPAAARSTPVAAPAIWRFFWPGMSVLKDASLG